MVLINVVDFGLNKDYIIEYAIIFGKINRKDINNNIILLKDRLSLN